MIAAMQEDETFSIDQTEPVLSDKSLEAAQEMKQWVGSKGEIIEHLAEERSYDPAKLLPYTKVMIESSPETEKLPKAYGGAMGNMGFDVYQHHD